MTCSSFNVATFDLKKQGTVVLNHVFVCFCVSQMIMDEVYKLITHMYLKCLIQTSQKKLTKRWSPDVGQRVENDAMILHKTISELVR